jgi:hypothetical protein
MHVRSLYRSGSLTTVAKELARYKLVLVDLHKFRRDIGGTVKSRGLYFSKGNGNKNHQLGTGFFVHH